MDTTALKLIPGYRYNEYLLVLSPHEELWNKIVKVKEEFAVKFDAPAARRGKPHITLVKFLQLEMAEERLLNRLRTIAMGYAPFKVELKDFGSFPDHTIYINIESRQQVHNLARSIRPAQRLMTLNKEHKPHFIDNPYLTVAIKLQAPQYEKAWLEYRHRHFTGRFIADGMLLLKRKPGDKSYQIVQRLEFMNLPVSTVQGELFL
jgi:2'-5' RNA ligase